MPDWKKLYCPKIGCHNLLGYSNGRAIIHGGTLFHVAKINILCRGCGEIQKLKLATEKNFVKFLSQKEIQAVIGNS